MYDFRTVRFGSGAHNSREDGMCIMEAVAYVAGEPHSDHPKCACPVISAFCRDWNDGLASDDERARLLGPYVWRLPGTRSPKHELRRGEMVLDWLVREQAPLSLETVPELVQYAEQLRGLPAITAATVGQAAPILSAARSAARIAARSAAWSAAWIAAWSAAESAARSAARSAAESAAWSAALSAAWSAAESAAWSAALSALRRRLVSQSQQSACGLLDRMISLTEIKERPQSWHDRARDLCGV